MLACSSAKFLVQDIFYKFFKEKEGCLANYFNALFRKQADSCFKL